jgi:aspartate-semialdehyde dehydrogenase
MDTLGVAILSASGLVSQRFQERLDKHPWFELRAIAGSKETAGRRLSTLEWRLESTRPDLPELLVISLENKELVEEILLAGVDVVFSALPSAIARRVEPRLSEAGIQVFSNASAFRCIDGIPLVIADLNPHHLRHWNSSELGPLACSTNCTVVPVALPLKPLWDMVGFHSLKIRTEQALSGGGWRLLLDEEALAGNVNPEIPDEAAKIEEELLHLLGRVCEKGIKPANIDVQVQCERIPVKDGHMVHVEVELNRKTSLEEVKEWMNAWSDRPQHLELPSAPSIPVIVVDEVPDRELHLMAGEEKGSGFDLKAGMAVVVGGMEVEGKVLRFSALSHNTVRGAAGGCMLLAELVMAEGMLNVIST